MKRILTILTLTLTLTITAQTVRPLRVYLAGGIVDRMVLSSGSSLYHSRLDLNDVEHDDYVSLVVADADGERRYMLSQVDSLVMPNGRRVVFQGSMTEQPSEARLVESPLPAGVGAGRPRRSSFEGHFPGAGKDNVTFKWTENDRIRLDVGYESRASQLTQDKTSAQFVFDSADLDAPSYAVYYPGKSVTILSEQTQTGADNTDHIGPSGDCGTATATRNDNVNDNVNFSFTLQHQAAYLCFLPHIDHLPSVRIEKIVLTCSNAIAGTYQLATGGLYNGSATSNTITLNLVPQKPSDFFLGHSVNSEQDSCASYMVIAPQDASRSFTATYYLTDTLSHISKVYRQTFSFRPLANTVYPVSCNIRDTEFRTIDLGLSCNWSNVNVNATEPSKDGPQYASEAEANAALLEQTIVTEWLIPDADQKEELLTKCQWTWGKYNGRTGYLVTGAAAAKEYGERLRIFIPSETQVTPAECLAQNYRPVEVLMVDLGLPSKTKWAARNIGANSAEDFGYYYAWGEVDTKTEYNYNTYTMRTGGTYLNLGDDYSIAGTQNDAAVVNWGGIWTTPTKAHFDELLNTSICSWSRMNINGVNGYLVTGPNGNRIFFPDAGYMVDRNLSCANEGASYMIANQVGDRSVYNWTLSWHYNYNSAQRYLYGGEYYEPFWKWGHSCFRYYGRSVRPVASPNGITTDGLVLNVRTDSASWRLGDTETVLYGTLSSTTPIKNMLTVGFVVGDSTNIDLTNSRFVLSKTTNLGGVFTDTLDVYDNIGYYYRAFINTGDTVFYGKTRHYAYEMVDLGLSVKWANMNIGADQPSDFGNYYAWGETEPKDEYSSSTYLYRTNQNLGENMNIAGTDQDVAHVKMGNAWRMPNYSEMKELIDSCTWVRTSVDNVSGYRVTSNRKGYTNKSIFLPSAGLVRGTSYDCQNIGASYFTSSQGGNNSVYAWALSWHSDYNNWQLYYYGGENYEPFWAWGHSTFRYYGRTVRAVAVPNTPTADGLVVNIATDSVKWKLGNLDAKLYATLSSSTPLTRNVTVGFLVGDNDSIVKESTAVLYDLHHDTDKAGSYNHTVAVHDNFGYWFRAYVDTGDTIFYGKARHYGLEIVNLGLSSGTLWANMNVGANTPEEFGDYFAWGETITKDDYSAATYLFSPTNLNLGDGRNIAGTELDAAHVNMGNAWQLPSKAQLVELRDECTWSWTSVNNVSGFRVTGPNKNSIFLPAAGLVRGTSHDFNCTGSDSRYHGASYMSADQGSDTSPYTWTLSWCADYGSYTRYIPGGENYEPFWAWGHSTYRYYGRTARAVFAPNGKSLNDIALNVETNKATWNLDDDEATISGKWSSNIAPVGSATVGFVIGDSAKIVIGTDRADLRFTKQSTENESFQTTLTISENMGYWYRSFVEYEGTVLYGPARHVGWEKVDLGLPSGTLWANMNVGASWPEDDGNYYAWGETATKISYTSDNYLLSGENLGNIAGSYDFDAAYRNMGSGWKMPTYDQLVELRDHCLWTRTNIDNANGYLVKGPNGNSIFLPYAGFMTGSSVNYPGNNSDYRYQGGSYWSSQIGSNNSYAWTLSWCQDYGSGTRYIIGGENYEPFWGWGTGTVRWPGRSVRAVAAEKAQRP
ncbi:MAG: hypothetical protein II864_01480 [Prevotella sp.]|nr:hypothetical protein [Prevotella sp.]